MLNPSVYIAGMTTWLLRPVNSHNARHNSQRNSELLYIVRRLELGRPVCHDKACYGLQWYVIESLPDYMVNLAVSHQTIWLWWISAPNCTNHLVANKEGAE